MNVGTAHSEVNPNTRVMSSRGIWLSYVLGIGLLHVILLSIPFVSVPVVWTLTNLIHNMCMYIFLHTVKGTPFETPDQGKARLLTHWEQMDYGVQFTASRKFLTITPIILLPFRAIMNNNSILIDGRAKAGSQLSKPEDSGALCPLGADQENPPAVRGWLDVMARLVRPLQYSSHGLTRWYFLTSFYTKYDKVHFVINTVSLLTVLIPKLPQLHGVRLFGINRY
ncbi:hypothetical protein JZ751_008061 [Albula glossodonta]|uniref:ORM1-like protein 3 n=1 Tax=Albula glossodonta TaxID=121402 RepID=A0A8T2P3C3_9TELE|nr:hypothetical protein JZ751_008061 [Albula glossodonta]